MKKGFRIIKFKKSKARFEFLNISKSFNGRSILKKISLKVYPGEIVGLLGPNGAGKSTLLKMLNGLVKPDHGKIEMRGKIAALIELGAGFNPLLTGLENIYINGTVLGLSRSEIDAKLDSIIEFSEVGEFLEMPVQSYSSGMRVRLGFAVAVHLEPDILLLDEILAVGDAGFRAKCFNKISEACRELKRNTDCPDEDVDNFLKFICGKWNS